MTSGMEVDPVQSYELDQKGVQTAVIYARVSTDDSDQTVENQLPLCRDYCERLGYKIVGEYAEEHTGSTINRPKFLEMLGRLSLGDVNFVVVYDQSRLTRSDEPNGDFKYVQKLINDRHALIRFVAYDIDPKSKAGRIITGFNSFTNSEYNEELSRKTTIGMQTRKAQGDFGTHVGHPAKIMFVEDIPTAPAGRFQEPDERRGIVGTKAITEEYLYSFARQGISLAQAARIIGVSPNTLVAEMKPREQNPRRRLKKVAIAKARDPDYQVKETDYVSYYRFKGVKDRYTPYMTLYEDAIRTRKGDTSERVGNDPENTSERGVGE